MIIFFLNERDASVRRKIKDKVAFPKFTKWQTLLFLPLVLCYGLPYLIPDLLQLICHDYSHNNLNQGEKPRKNKGERRMEMEYGNLCPAGHRSSCIIIAESGKRKFKVFVVRRCVSFLWREKARRESCCARAAP
jgi:hypothetical protein